MSVWVPPDKEALDRYEAWNRAIARRFFAGTYAHRPVYIDIDDAELDLLGRDASPELAIGEGPDAFRSAMIRTIRPDSGLFRWHKDRLNYWKAAGGTGTPPFLALLSLLCHAAEGMHGDARYSPNNYYDRFFDLANVPRDRRTQAQNEFRRDTPEYWDELRRWLVGAEGAYGLPTAEAFDHRRFIGLPLSQVLLREHERSRLREMFEQLDLRPKQRMSPSDMLRALHVGVASRGVTGQFQRLWNSGAEMRQRLAQLACIELESWDGATVDTEEGVTQRSIHARLRVAASIRMHPRESVILSLVTTASSRVATGRYTWSLGSLLDTDNTATDSADVRVEQSESVGWLEVRSADRIEFDQVLLSILELKPTSDGPILARSARSVAVLTRDEDLGRFVESEHAELNHESIVIARERWIARLKDVLTGACRPGFRVVESSQLAGLPAGWVAFMNVHLVRLPQLRDDEYELAGLIPLMWTQLAIGGGFKLPGTNTWHSADPPEITASTVETASVKLIVESDDGSAVVEKDFTDTTVVWQVSSLTDGDYRAAIRSSGNNLAQSASFRLRSAASRRMPVAMQPAWMGHDILTDPGWGSLSATSVPTPPKDGVQGARCIGSGFRLQDPVSLPKRVVGGSDDSDNDGPTDSTGSHAPEASSPPLRGCIDGAHHWKLNDVLNPGGYYRPSKGTCRRCGLRQTFPARPTHSAIVSPSQSTAPPVAAVRAPERVSMDLLFDGICYGGRDNWSTFVRLADTADDAQWFPMEVARTLSALGHVDFVIDPEDFSPTKWQVAPVTLAVVGERAFLAGYRSAELKRSLQRNAELWGASFECTAWPMSPSTWSVEGLQRESMEDFAETLTRETGVDVLVVADPGRVLASVLPRLSTILRSCPPFVPPAGGSVERFNPKTSAWVPELSAVQPGGYRFKGPFGNSTTAYFSGRTWRRADVSLVKYLAASRERLSLMGSSYGHLYVPLGARLPGLFERAAVLCSGYPPQKLKDGTIQYDDVPEDVAATIYSCLITELAED